MQVGSRGGLSGNEKERPNVSNDNFRITLVYFAGFISMTEKITS